MEKTLFEVPQEEIHNVYLVPTMRLLVKWVEDITSSDFTEFLDETLPKFFQRDLLSNIDQEAADQVIRSATKINSEILGLEDAIGTIEEGKIADLLVLGKDPTEDVRIFQEDGIIECIFMDGVPVVDHGKMLL